MFPWKHLIVFANALIVKSKMLSNTSHLPESKNTLLSFFLSKFRAKYSNLSKELLINLGSGYAVQFNIEDFDTITVTRGSITTGYVYDNKIFESGLVASNVLKQFSIALNNTFDLSEYGDYAFYITGDATVKLSKSK